MIFARLPLFKLAMSIAFVLGASALAADDLAKSEFKPSSQWDEDDEKVFLMLRDSNPLLLKSYVEIFAKSKSVEKRLVALEALSYDRIFPDAPEVFGKDYRVNHLVRLIADNDSRVRSLATEVLESLIPQEVTAIIPRLQKALRESPENSVLRKELVPTIDQLVRRKKQ